MLDVTFSSGVKFTWNIVSDAQSQPVGARVGSASNGFETWVVAKVGFSRIRQQHIESLNFSDPLTDLYCRILKGVCSPTEITMSAPRSITSFQKTYLVEKRGMRRIRDRGFLSFT